MFLLVACLCTISEPMKINLIKEARLAKRYSQENVAMDLKLSQSQYSRRENGYINFSLDEIRRLCKILNLDLLQTVIGLLHISESEQDSYHKKEFDLSSEEMLKELHKSLTESKILVTSLLKKIN